MTKMKSRKMTKSTFAIIIMGIAMVAMLAFGGTFAYFTASVTPVNGSVTTAHINLTTQNSFATLFVNDPVVPGQKITTGEITLTSDANTAVWVFVNFEVSVLKNAQPVANVAANDLIQLDALTSVVAYTTPAQGTEGEEDYHAAETHNWVSGSVYEVSGGTERVVYGIKLPASNSEIILKVCDALTFKSSVYQNNLNGTLQESSVSYQNNDETVYVDLEDVTIQITLSAQSIQAFKDYGGDQGAARDLLIEEAYCALNDEYQTTNPNA